VKAEIGIMEQEQYSAGIAPRFQMVIRPKNGTEWSMLRLFAERMGWTTNLYDWEIRITEPEAK